MLWVVKWRATEISIEVKIGLSCQLVAVSCFISNNIITKTIEYLGVDVQIQAVSNITVGISDYQY